MSRSVGSNPTVSAMNETSFVYCDKRGFFLHFGQKRANIGKIGLSDGGSAVRIPDFFASDRKKVKIAGVLFAFLCSEKNSKKIRGGWI